MAAGLASGIATEAAIVSKAWSCVEDVAVAAAIAGAVAAPVTEAVAAIAAAAIASGAVPPWPELAPATDAVAKTSVGAAVRGIVTGIATATASAMAADGRSCLGSVESAAGASPKSGFAIDFESSAFAGWDFDLESFAASGFAPVSVIVCSAGAESPPGASLFAG